MPIDADHVGNFPVFVCDRSRSVGWSYSDEPAQFVRIPGARNARCRNLARRSSCNLKNAPHCQRISVEGSLTLHRVHQKFNKSLSDDDANSCITIDSRASKSLSSPVILSLHAPTLAPSKGRLMRCTVPALTPNRSAILRTPGLHNCSSRHGSVGEQPPDVHLVGFDKRIAVALRQRVATGPRAKSAVYISRSRARMTVLPDHGVPLGVSTWRAFNSAASLLERAHCADSLGIDRHVGPCRGDRIYLPLQQSEKLTHRAPTVKQ
jgi:hypothetical protein